MRFAFCLALLAAACVASPALAEKNAAITPKLASISSPTITETFDSKLAPPLSAVKGEWATEGGVLIGKELAADKHAAVLNYQKKNRNSVVRFSFKLEDTTTGFSLSLNHEKGHLFRVTVTPAALNVALDKDKKDPKSKAIALGSSKRSFEQGKWYTMQVEMQGDKVVAQVDNGAVVEASHPSLDTDKPNYRFVMKGSSLSLDDLQIWETK